MVYKFFEKKIGSGVKENEKLAEELHKPIIEKIQRENSLCEINIWATDLAEMRSLSSKSKNVRYLLCLIDVLPNMYWLKL